jgi:DNA-binding PadR family transcriptional regulator
LVEGLWRERKRTYKLTDKGEETIATILGVQEKIKVFLASILRTVPMP